MKKHHKEQISPKIKALSEKINALLKEEGLEEFHVIAVKFEHNSKLDVNGCGPGMMLCPQPVTGGYKMVCCPLGTC